MRNFLTYRSGSSSLEDMSNLQNDLPILSNLDSSSMCAIYGNRLIGGDTNGFLHIWDI